jgi:branched-chain amino acid transport system permease protein
MAKARQTLPILVLLGVAFALPHIWDRPYYMHLMVLLWIMAIFAISYNLYLGFLGGFSMGQPAFFGVGGYATGLVTAKLDWPAGLGLLVAVGVVGVGAFIIGFPALRLKGPYFVLITIALLGIVGNLSNTLYKVTGGSSGLRNIPAPVIGVGNKGWDFHTTNYFYYLALGFLIIIYIVVQWLIYSRIGRGFIAVRDNEDLANSLGINPFRYKMIGFIASAVISGVAGWLYAHYVHILDPTVFGFNYVFDVMFMVILGGTGTLPGPVVGAFIVVFIPEILRMAAEWRMFYFALFMLAMIIFMPMGLWGFVKMQQYRYQEWKAMRLAEGLSAGLQSYLMYLDKEYWGKVTDFTSLMRAKFRRGADQEV